MLERIGKYKVESLLGQGGMGTVYLALDSQIQRRVAIKVFKLEITSADARTAERFRAEAQTTAGLRHPHIVTVYEYGEQDGVPYIVMEYLQGTDLHRVLQQGSRLTMLEKVQIIAETASGLQYAHEKGIIHRDIKPANIMLLPNGSAMLTDFGIARGAQLADTRLTPTHLMMGTLAFMAPELFYHSDASIYSDMFAFGLVCYELLTGIHPFRAPAEAMVIQKILYENPEPVRGLLRDCPEDLSQAVGRLLAKHKEHRFASLADFEMVLQPILVDLRHTHASDLVPIAEQHLVSDHLDEARRALRKIADFDPGNVSLSGLLRRLDERQRALSVGPQVASLSAEAEQLILARRTEEALGRIQQAIELAPADHTLRARAAEIQEMQQRLAQAQTLLEEAHRDLEGRNFTSAVRKVNQARHADPEIPGASALFEEIQHALKRQDREAAIQDAVKRAKMSMLVDDFDAAFTILDSALTDYSDSTELNKARAEAQSLRDDHDRRRRIEETKQKVRICLDRNGETEALSLLDALREQGIEDADLKRLRAAVVSRVTETRQRAELDAGLLNARQAMQHGSYAQARRILTDLSQITHDDRIDTLIEEVKKRASDQGRESAISGVIAKAADLRAHDRVSEAVALLDRAIGEIGADPRLTALRDQLAGLDQSRRQQQLDAAVREIETFLDQQKLTSAQKLLEKALPTAPADARLLALRTRLEAERRARADHRQEPTFPAAPPPPREETGESTLRIRLDSSAAPTRVSKARPPETGPPEVEIKRPPPEPAAAALNPQPVATARPMWLIPAVIGALAGVAIFTGVLLRDPAAPAPQPTPPPEAAAKKEPARQEPPAPVEPTPAPAPKPTLMLQPSVLSFNWTQGDAAPAAKNVRASGSSGPWTAVPSDRWILVAQAQGAGSGQWRVGVVANRIAPGVAATGHVTISGAGVSATLPVTATVTPKAPPQTIPAPPKPEPKPPAEPADRGRKILSASEYAGDPFGTLTWMGELKDQETLTLTTSGPSTGQLLGKRIGGDWFPPIRFSVQLSPALRMEQAPAEGNRFGRMVIRNTTGAPVTNFRITWRQSR